MVDTPRSEAAALDAPRPITKDATEDTLAATAVTGHERDDGSHDGPRLDDGAVVGRYIVVGQLGAGGMGVVYVAYDPELDRRVALKLLRRKTIAGTPARTRLLREAQALARLSHPNVVTVHDVGEHDGQVFLAMEFVQGDTLRKWLRAQRRTVREILDVLVLAGRGLAAAHAKGIVHRDFKPDNVMVGDDGRVRVMDFGLARPGEPHGSLVGLASDSLRDTSASDPTLTRAGATMGTPAYMAPEQHLRQPADERTDQFSYCVTVYEALYGARPFSGDTLAALSWSITEGRRSPTPRGSGVPQWVQRAVSRGLSTDPAERWPSVEALLDELARDPGPARRRWIMVGAGLAIVGGALGYRAWQRAGVDASCVREGEAIAQVWSADRQAAIGQALEATGVGYAADSWRRAAAHLDDYTARWTELRVDACRRTQLERTWPPPTLERARECFDERLAQLDTLLEGFEAPEAAIVPRVVTVVAQLAPVSECVDEAWLARRPASPDDPPLRGQLAALRRRLAEVGGLASTGRYAEALTRAQAIADEALALGSMALVAEARLAVGLALERQGDFERAQTELEQAYLVAGGAGHDVVSLKAANRLGFLTGYQLAKHDEGLRWAAIAEMHVTRLGLTDDPAVVEWLGNLGSIHQARGKYDEALAAQQRALEVAQRVYAEGHPRLATTWTNLANAYHGLGDYEQAIVAHGKAVAICEASQGEFHPDLAMALLNLGATQHQREDDEAAIASFSRALEIQTAAFGDDHPQVARTLNNLGAMYFAKGDDAKARQTYERALAIQRQTLGEDHPDLAGPYNNLGKAQARQGDFAAALASYERALAIRVAALGPEHPHVARVYESMGVTQRELGEPTKAVEAFEKALAIAETSLGAEHPKVAAAMVRLGEALVDAGDGGRAAEQLERALTLQVGTGAPAGELGKTRFALARALWSDEAQRDRAQQLARQAKSDLREAPPELLAELEAWLGEHGG